MTRGGPVVLLALAALLLPPGSRPVEAGADESLRRSVEELCAPAMEGRRAGSRGAEAAADWIAVRFAAAGLEPAGDGGGWFQDLPPGPGPDVDGALPLRNVLGRLPGAGRGCVVVGAHYDHLGIDEEGRIHPGADDNASGVAAMIAVAEALAVEAPFPRSILFAAFTGEEVGLLGSRRYAEDPVCPLEETIAMLNLDTVGRMEERRLFAFSAASARELPGTLAGVNLGFGFQLEMPEKGPFASDQIPFLDNGVPAIHLFTGPNPDYHRPTDTPEKLDYGALAEIAAFTAETARFLAERARPLAFVPPGSEAAPRASAGGGGPARRASLGTIPDFADQGEGVLLSGVLPGSPAAGAGMGKGDRLVSIDATAIRDLQDLTIALKERSPGDTVRVGFLRGGEKRAIEAVLVERR